MSAGGCTTKPRDNLGENAAERATEEKMEIDANGHDGSKVHGRNIRDTQKKSPRKAEVSKEKISLYDRKNGLRVLVSVRLFFDFAPSDIPRTLAIQYLTAPFFVLGRSCRAIFLRLDLRLVNAEAVTSGT